MLTVQAESFHAQARRSRARRLGLAAGPLLVLVLALFAGAQARAANGVIASDSFSRTVSGGWGTADVGGAWTVLDSAASWSVSPGTGSVGAAATAQRRAVLGSVSVQDVDLLAKVTLPRCTGTGHYCDAFLLGRVSAGTNPTYYRVGVVQGPGSSDILLRTQRSDGTNLGSDLDTGIPAADGAQVMLRVRVPGGQPDRDPGARVGGGHDRALDLARSTSPTPTVRSRSPARSGCDCATRTQHRPHLRPPELPSHAPLPSRAVDQRLYPVQRPVGSSVTISGSISPGERGVFGGRVRPGSWSTRTARSQRPCPGRAVVRFRSRRRTARGPARPASRSPAAAVDQRLYPVERPGGYQRDDQRQLFQRRERVSSGYEHAGFVVNSDSQISATVPAGASSGQISVTTPNGTGTSTASFTVSPPSAAVDQRLYPVQRPGGYQRDDQRQLFQRRDRGVVRGYEYVRVRSQLGQPDLSDRARGGEQWSDFGHDPERHGDQRGQLHGQLRQRARWLRTVSAEQCRVAGVQRMWVGRGRCSIVRRVGACRRAQAVSARPRRCSGARC